MLNEKLHDKLSPHMQFLHNDKLLMVTLITRFHQAIPQQGRLNLTLFPAYLVLKNATPVPFSCEIRPRQDKSGCLRKNRTGLDMLEKVLWQPPGRFELSLAEEFFRLVMIMS
jgi:hypothetical protein